MKESIRTALQAFTTGTLSDNALNLFDTLGYNTSRRFELSHPSYEGFADDFGEAAAKMNSDRACVTEWLSIELLFQITSEEMQQSMPLFEPTVRRDDPASYLFFCVELTGENWTQTQLAQIVQEINKGFKMHVFVIFKYGSYLTLSLIERRPNRRRNDADVMGKVTHIKDIDLKSPHRAHVEILNDLVLGNLRQKFTIDRFVQLHFAWQNTLSISALNKKFYDDVIGWFELSIQGIKLPGQQAKSQRHKDFSIRLIARLVFVWFLKELNVINDRLLRPDDEHNPLIKPNLPGSSYYKFVLQNLFFNALNKEQTDRTEAIQDFDLFAGYFDQPDQIKELILACPFLNGGLFDEMENDFVSRSSVNNAFVVPDELLIGRNGLNTILTRYKFTIVENTPLTEEVAIDPEMLGRIFENLLAEQSADTQEAARKNAGAFYTPRPVVSYMCQNVLLRHIGIDITPDNGKAVVHKLLETTVIDPACGSGAFPMGMLEEMMNILDIVDPDGRLWVGEMLKSKDAAFRDHIADFIADNQIRYVKKLGLLKNCLFGIDLLDYAVEITKLRCWLSLIVEQKVDFSKPNYNLKPLPNLEFKFYKRNSLLRTFRGQNINTLIEDFDKDNLIDELVDLENSYFITNSDKYGTKEQIKQRIIGLLEGVVDQQTRKTQKDHTAAQNDLNRLVSGMGKASDITKARNKVKKLAVLLAELADFREAIKDYFIERIVFPGIFNKNRSRPGFDIVIGNPPYVNTKLISQMGMTDALKEEYGFCDDLYNHFTFRGVELLREGGFLSYITSDTFLTIQSKENMRQLFLGIKEETLLSNVNGQTALFGSPAEQLTELSTSPTHTEGCRLLEIINTPKAFAAMVDTAIFTLEKNTPLPNQAVVYVDIRFPTASSFGLTDDEWKAIQTSKNSVAGWEKVLDRAMHEIQLPLNHADQIQPDWQQSHSCHNRDVCRDKNTLLERYRLPLSIYNESLNYALFAPNAWNSRVYDRVIRPAFPTFTHWWGKIETSRRIEDNRPVIEAYTSKLKPGDMTILGLITDGGVGLQTGDNGKLVGALRGTDVANRIYETRPEKLMGAVDEYPALRTQNILLANCHDKEDYKQALAGLNEQQIRDLFDTIKDQYGRRVFGKGYMFRIIDTAEFRTADSLTDDEKTTGIHTGGTEIYVPYDKGDKDGNRWYLDTPYGLQWSEPAVAWLKSNSGKNGEGMPVVRNPQFYFRNGFCWSDVLNPSAIYIKSRLKNKTVNDVLTMSLYDEIGYGDKFFVTVLNSYLAFKIVREFLNTTVHLQMNDLRKLPIVIPTVEQRQRFDDQFDACRAIKERQFSGILTDIETETALRPLEREVDRMVEELYGLTN